VPLPLLVTLTMCPNLLLKAAIKAIIREGNISRLYLGVDLSVGVVLHVGSGRWAISVLVGNGGAPIGLYVSAQLTGLRPNIPFAI
jgi:hypothetical protein